MTMLLTIITIIVPTILLIWLFVSFVFFDSGYKSRYAYLHEDRTKTNFNLIALILNIYECLTEVDWKDKLIPKTSIDKEIAEEEKEISELERQKEKMDKLAELKRRKERLFKEVHSGTNADCQWCGEDDCLKPAYTVDGIAQYYCTSCHRWLNDGSSMV